MLGLLVHDKHGPQEEVWWSESGVRQHRSGVCPLGAELVSRS